VPRAGPERAPAAAGLVGGHAIWRRRGREHARAGLAFRGGGPRRRRAPGRRRAAPDGVRPARGTARRTRPGRAPGRRRRAPDGIRPDRAPAGGAPAQIGTPWRADRHVRCASGLREPAILASDGPHALQGGLGGKAPGVRHLRRAGGGAPGEAAAHPRRRGVAVRRASLPGLSHPAGGAGSGPQSPRGLEPGRRAHPPPRPGPRCPSGPGGRGRPGPGAPGLLGLAHPAPGGRGALCPRGEPGRRGPRPPRAPRRGRGPAPRASHGPALVRRGALAPPAGTGPPGHAEAEAGAALRSRARPRAPC
jgi:hypothetical protein